MSFTPNKRSCEVISYVHRIIIQGTDYPESHSSLQTRSSVIFYFWQIIGLRHNVTSKACISILFGYALGSWFKKGYTNNGLFGVYKHLLKSIAKHLETEKKYHSFILFKHI